MVCASFREAETDVPSLTDSEEETIVLAVELNAPLVAETRSGHSYLKKYNGLVANPPDLLQSQPSPPQNNPGRNRKNFGFLEFFQKHSGRIHGTLPL